MQHQGKNVRELWYVIRALHKRNTRGQRGLAKMKWMSFRQGATMTLSGYISKFNSLHTDLLLRGVTFDAEAQLLQFQAGLDPKRFSLEALGALEFQDLTRFGVSSSYTLENCITHLKGMEERSLQQNMLYKSDAGAVKGGGGTGGDQVLFTSSNNNKRKNPGSGDKTTKCSWCQNKGHTKSECNKKKLFGIRRGHKEERKFNLVIRCQ